MISRTRSAVLTAITTTTNQFVVLSAIFCTALIILQNRVSGFVLPSISYYHRPVTATASPNHLSTNSLPLYSSIPRLIILSIDDDDDGNNEEPEEDEDEDDEPEEPDPYREGAGSSEFAEDDVSNKSSSMIPAFGKGASLSTTTVDWGGALGRLRERVQDVESGDSQNPSKVLFRLMSSQSPNQAIGSFVSRANPQVVQAMSGAVSSLLGGLSNPMSGVEMIVQASGEKVATLCFQLQMTGYMFRNAEYVLALKEIMDLDGAATLQDYQLAFDKLDEDGSGYIEASEVQSLLNDVYDGEVPSFEVDNFIKFFDENGDGRVSWEEFKRGLGAAMAKKAEQKSKLRNLLGEYNKGKSPLDSIDDEDEDDDDEDTEIEASVAGTIEIELQDGSVVEVDADEYMTSLKNEANSLKQELRRLKTNGSMDDGQVTEFLAGGASSANGPNANMDDPFNGLAEYIASRQGDIQALTEGISPEIVETMKMLVDYVLEGGESGKARKKGVRKEEMNMELPASALQQLALWQLILGYSLREAEAKGDYLKLLE